MAEFSFQGTPFRTTDTRVGGGVLALNAAGRPIIVDDQGQVIDATLRTIGGAANLPPTDNPFTDVERRQTSLQLNQERFNRGDIGIVEALRIQNQNVQEAQREGVSTTDLQGFTVRGTTQGSAGAAGTIGTLDPNAPTAQIAGGTTAAGAGAKLQTGGPTQIQPKVQPGGGGGTTPSTPRRTAPPGFTPGPVGGDDLQNFIDRSANFPITQAQNPLIQQVQQVQSRSVREQQSSINQFGATGRQALFSAAPELQALSQQLQQQVEDPLGGGLREDIAERIRVQQASAGLASGGQAAFTEAAGLAQVAQQRRLQAGQQLQGLGQNVLGQLGLGTPLTADLAGIGQTFLAGQTLSALQASGQAQAQQSEQIFNQVFSFLNRPQQQPGPTTNITVGGGGGGGGTRGGGGFTTGPVG